MKLSTLEIQRQAIQAELDGLKTQEERNIMGQFSTPIVLANALLNYAAKIFPKHSIVRFLDPAFGTGSFFSALNNAFKSTRVEAAVGFEIDNHYGEPAKKLWANTVLDFKLDDFTCAIPPNIEKEKYNLIICNPPYVRHHHINGEKFRLQSKAEIAANMKLSGLAGLYCYFLALSHQWMKKNAIAGWLIPSEFMDVNYGKAVKEYLLNEVTLLHIHRFNPSDVQFNDALVSSAIVWFKNKKTNANYKVRFTYGGDLDNPAHVKEIDSQVLADERKWTRFPLSSKRVSNNAAKLSDYFIVKRGIATGDNGFFILPLSKINEMKLPLSQFRPILPSPRYLDKIIINADSSGNPEITKQLFVLDCKLEIDEIRDKYPALYTYLQYGIKIGVSERYLCKHRKLWYAQENRPESIFYCTYIGRSDKKGKKPFRFILNRSKAIVANSYLILYPKSNLEAEISDRPNKAIKLLEILNEITEKEMIDEGRVYGGGMHKLEPKELSNVPVSNILNLD